MLDLSIVIPARNEEWLAKTVESILRARTANTEVIVVLDGYWPNPVIQDHRRVKLIHHTEPIGQRAATNEAVRLSQAKYVMKCDAHCDFDKGFDTKMIADMQPDYTLVPTMFNLHVFDWKCPKCGEQWYMGPYPDKCMGAHCDNSEGFERVVVWKRRRRYKTTSMRFDSSLHFQYWHGCSDREWAKPAVSELMCCIGACWMMERDRYWQLGGMDEAHGSWGQMGVEVACKSWLSGGKLMCSKNTWFAHMFRTQPGFGFPYKMNTAEQSRNRSHDIWYNNKWDGQKYKLSWLLERFWPVPGWTDADLKAQKDREK